MKKLLFLFISILLSFCSINPANAQSRYFYSAGCLIFEACPSYFIDLPLGLPGPAANFGDSYRKNFVNDICKKLTNDINSINKNYSLDSSVTTIVYSANVNDSIYYGHAQGQPFNFIECVIPPPKIPGCTNPNALNYNPEATEENGTCIEKIEGCTDSTALNYNPNANVHKESMCEYTPPYTPQDISGAFQKSQVSIGATTWTIVVNLNVPNANLDPSVIQTWNRFKAVSATTNEKTLEIVMRQFDDQRLEIEECTSYELTIPRNALYTTEGDTNANPISGNFEVIGCPEKPTNDDEQTGAGKIQEIQQKYKSTMNQDAFYIRLFDVDQDGNQHINLGNLIFLIGFAGFFMSAMFLFLNFLKNSFIGKKSSR